MLGGKPIGIPTHFHLLLDLCPCTCKHCPQNFAKMMTKCIFFLSVFQLFFVTIWPVLHKCQRLSRILGLFCLFEMIKIVSLGSTSFIEEQHQTVYFLFLTSVILAGLVHRSQIKTKNWIQLLFFMGLFRVFRKWNQTGDKWAHLEV